MESWHGKFSPLDTREQLEEVLQDEVFYCGCDQNRAAVEVLRAVLDGAQEWKDGLIANPQDSAQMERGRSAILSRLNYESNPGLAVWFLYWLDHLGLIEHYSIASVSAITDKGRWLLDGIKRLYPPDQSRSIEADRVAPPNSAT